MHNNLEYSIFQNILFPTSEQTPLTTRQNLSLTRAISHQIDPAHVFSDLPWVIFDFETTGLNAVQDRVIEIGAIKVLNGELIDQISTLIKVDIPIPEVVQKITGITPTMLEDKPRIDDYLTNFFDFIQGSVLVAHNAEFDLAFLKSESKRVGFNIAWPCVCTLKMARELLEELPRKNLDTLAEYYDLQFEARHRSIGDAKVTAEVLKKLLENEGKHLLKWHDFQPYQVVVSN